MPVISGRRAFLELLKQQGVEYVFGNPGTTELQLMDAFAVENDIKYVLGLQEAALMAMADGYAQASGKLAVINLHAAPGLGNAMGMLYDAMKANAPVLVTAGQQDLEFVIEEPVLVTDLPTPQSYPAVADPGPVAPPAGPVETAPSALGYRSMKQVPYPVIAKRQRLEGTVLLRVLVGADGVPQRIDVERSSGHSVLDRAAREAVMTWRFEPGTRNGQPFAAYGLVPIAFRLTEL